MKTLTLTTGALVLVATMANAEWHNGSRDSRDRPVGNEMYTLLSGNSLTADILKKSGAVYRDPSSGYWYYDSRGGDTSLSRWGYTYNPNRSAAANQRARLNAEAAKHEAMRALSTQKSLQRDLSRAKAQQRAVNRNDESTAKQRRAAQRAVTRAERALAK